MTDKERLNYRSRKNKSERNWVFSIWSRRKLEEEVCYIHKKVGWVAVLFITFEIKRKQNIIDYFNLFQHQYGKNIIDYFNQYGKKCGPKLLRPNLLILVIVVQLLSHIWLFATPWDSPGKNTGVGCHFLLQGIFLTQGSNPHLLHCRWILYF